MKRVRKLLFVSGVAVAAFIVAGAIYVYRPPDDGRTPAERRQIAEACLTMLHSALTNEVDDIKPDDPRLPEVIRAFDPHHIEVIPNFSVDIYRAENPKEYILMRLSHPTNTWALCIAGPSVFPGGGREIFRIDMIEWPNEAIHRMSGTHICSRFGWLRMPLIGDLDRWAPRLP